MNKTSRLVALFFGTLLVLAFFLPWLTGDLKIAKLSATGYDLFRGYTNVMDAIGQKPGLDILFVLVYPITGVLAVVFSGVIRLPYITLLSAMAAISYTAFKMADWGPDNLRRFSDNFGPGLWITLVCTLVIFVTSALQSVSSGRKKKKK